MKMTRVFGVVLTLAATMAVSGAMGQEIIENTANFVELKTAGTGTNQSGATLENDSYVQIKKTYGYYAMPDAAFHPGYHTTGTKGQLTAGFTWVWDIANASGFTVTAPTVSEPANFVRITAPAAVASGKILVKEKMPTTGAWGGCTDGTGFDFNIIAFGEPSFSLLTASSTPTWGDNGKILCSAGDVKVNFKVISSGMPYFKYKVDKDEAVIDAATGTATPKSGATWSTVTTETEVKLAPTTSWTANQVVSTFPPSLPTTGDGQQISLVTPLSSSTNALAEYTVTIQKNIPTPATTDPTITVYRITMTGVNGLISRKADYDQVTGAAPSATTGFTYYPTTPADKSYYVYIAKAPTTGPVFHIGNSKAN